MGGTEGREEGGQNMHQQQISTRDRKREKQIRPIRRCSEAFPVFLHMCHVCTGKINPPQVINFRAAGLNKAAGNA